MAVDFPIHNGVAKPLPINPNTNAAMASATDSTTWSKLEQAKACVAEDGGHTLGAVIGPNLVISIDGCVRNGKIDWRAWRLIEVIGAQWSFSPHRNGVDLYVQGGSWLAQPKRFHLDDWADEIEFRTGADIVVFGDEVHAATKNGVGQNNVAKKLLLSYVCGDDRRESLFTDLLLGDDDIVFTLAPFFPVQETETSKRAKKAKQRRSRVKKTKWTPPHGVHKRTDLHVNERLLALISTTRGQNYSLPHYLHTKLLSETDENGGGPISNASQVYATRAGITKRAAKDRLKKLAKHGYCVYYNQKKDIFCPISWDNVLKRFGLKPGQTAKVPPDVLFSNKTLKQLSYHAHHRTSKKTRPVKSRNELKRTTGASRHTQYTVERREGFDVQFNAIKVAEADGTPLPGFTFTQIPGGEPRVSLPDLINVPRPIIQTEDGWFAQIPNAITDPKNDAEVSADTTGAPMSSVSGFAQETYKRRYFVGERPEPGRLGVWMTGATTIASRPHDARLGGCGMSARVTARRSSYSSVQYLLGAAGRFGNPHDAVGRSPGAGGALGKPANRIA